MSLCDDIAMAFCLNGNDAPQAVVTDPWLRSRQLSVGLEECLAGRCTLQDTADPFLKAGILVDMTIKKLHPAVESVSVRCALVRVFMSEHVYIVRGDLFDDTGAVNEKYLLYLLSEVLRHLGLTSKGL